MSDPAPQPQVPTVHPVLAELAERIEATTSPDRRDALLVFSRMMLRRLADDDLTLRGVEQLLGTVRSAFAFVDARGNHPASVRVFVPTIETDGYLVPGTVIETNTDDSPFLVDSVNEELASRNLGVRLLVHPMIGTARAEDGHLERVMAGRDAAHRESLMHFELDRRLSAQDREDLEGRIRAILHDVRLVVRDFEPMQERVHHMGEIARQATVVYSPQEVGETVDFVEWLLHLNFVLLGYREYRMARGSRGAHDPGRAGIGIGHPGRRGVELVRRRDPAAHPRARRPPSDRGRRAPHHHEDEGV